MKNRLLQGEMIELENKKDVVNIWFQPKTNNFCLMLNSKVIKSTKTWEPIKRKLIEIGELKEFGIKNI
jgi:hypothetical protein